MKSLRILLFILLIIVQACSISQETNYNYAPGAPGEPPYWNHGGKIGIGTSYEAYDKLAYSDKAITEEVSKVWFTIGRDGKINETAWGMIHQMQIKDIIVAVKGNDFVDIEGADTHHKIEYLHTDFDGRPLSLAYKITSVDKDSLYTFEKHVFTDPDHQSLFIRFKFKSAVDSIMPYIFFNPYIKNTGIDDIAFFDEEGLHATEEKEIYLTVKSRVPFEKQSVGFKGTSGGLDDLLNNASLDSYYKTTGEKTGNVILTGGWNKISRSFETDIIIGFGIDLKSANEAANRTLEKGYNLVLDQYNGSRNYIGWEDYLDSLEHLPGMYENTGDNGKLLNVSAMVLKALEDKENSGALVASLSYPWGDSVKAQNSSTGYRAVWPRDFYQCAMALLALGDDKTPMAAYNFLKNIQVTNKTPENKGAQGWFLQKTVVDGTVEWYQVQLDQTAMPIMLGWNLWKKGLLEGKDLRKSYLDMIKPAAKFLEKGGNVDILDNQITLKPPFTQQERWEEQYGYSPSTTAAVITGLAAAAEIANHIGNNQAAVDFLIAADKYLIHLGSTTFTTSGPFREGEYYIRISRNNDPNDHELLGQNNGRPPMPEDQIVDAGFLELVRYGIKSPTDSTIIKSLMVLDDTSRNDILQVKYFFPAEGENYEGWRRYGNDGYGEDTTDGSNYGRMGPGQRGRVWPFLTGERGHYELAKMNSAGYLSAWDKQQLVNRYVKAMEFFANEGLMLPEQVWDNVGGNEIYNYKMGEGTSSATPLAWTHAEYVKLVKSITTGKVWDRYPIVEKRYQRSKIPNY